MLIFRLGFKLDTKWLEIYLLTMYIDSLYYWQDDRRNLFTKIGKDGIIVAGEKSFKRILNNNGWKCILINVLLQKLCSKEFIFNNIFQ